MVSTTTNTLGNVRAVDIKTVSRETTSTHLQRTISAEPNQWITEVRSPKNSKLTTASVELNAYGLAKREL